MKPAMSVSTRNFKSSLSSAVSLNLLKFLFKTLGMHMQTLFRIHGIDIVPVRLITSFYISLRKACQSALPSVVKLPHNLSTNYAIKICC